MPDCAGRRIVFRPNADYEMAADSAVALLFRPGDGVRHGFPGRHHANPAGMDFFGLFVLPLPTVCFVAVPARCRSTAASAVESFLRRYLYPGLASPSLFLVLVALAGFLLVGIVGTARKKRATFLLWAVGACLSPFALSLISGELQMQRSCQALPLFAGAALLGGWLLAERWKNRWTKCAVAALIAVVLLNVTIEIHGFFSGNYSLRTSEYRILDRVAADLQRDYPLAEKPVLFVGSPNARYYVLDPGLLITQDRLGYSTQPVHFWELRVPRFRLRSHLQLS